MISNWINVSDKLPYEGQFVLIVDGNGEVDALHYSNEEFEVWKISHWMPVPIVPEELIPVEEEDDGSCDEHIGCYSYPNCDEDPLGCSVRHGNGVEQYGHRV